LRRDRRRGLLRLGVVVEFAIGNARAVVSARRRTDARTDTVRPLLIPYQDEGGDSRRKRARWLREIAPLLPQKAEEGS
jgi:hypothetical protein